MGLFFGPFFLLGPVIGTGKEVTWHAVEAKNKIIGSARLHSNSETRASVRSPHLAGR